MDEGPKTTIEEQWIFENGSLKAWETDP